jgi:hypothetical protein
MTMDEEYGDDDASIMPLANISFTCSWMVFYLLLGIYMVVDGTV